MNKSKIEIALLALSCLVLVFVLRYGAGVYYHKKAVQLQERGLYNEAVAMYKKSLAFSPQAATTHYNLASCYVLSQDYDRAINEFQAASKLRSQYLPPLVGLAQAYAAKEKYLDALLVLNRARAISAGNQELKDSFASITMDYAVSCLNRGIDSYLAGDRNKAYELLQTAVSNKPDLAALYYTLGYFYHQDSDLDRSWSSARKTLEINPKFWPARKLLGDIYFERQAFTAAIEQYKGALEIHPDDVGLYNDLGIAYMQTEEYPQAAGYLKKALDLDPENSSIRYSLASVYRDNKDFPSALQVYKELVSIHPEFPHVHNDLADIYKNLGNSKQAAQEYLKEIDYSKRNLELEPDNPMVLDSMAYAYLGLKDYVKAEEIITRAIGLDPAFRQAYLTQAAILEATDRFNQSRDALAKAKSLPGARNFIERRESGVDKTFNSFLETIKRSYSDKVYLTNGRLLKGDIVEENHEKVVLEIKLGRSTGRVTAYTKDIDHIERAAEAYMPDNKNIR
jgi:tetratricopeptide (TPR) repeat protein